MMQDMTRGKKHCFQVSHKKNMQQRVFLLHAKEDEDMKQWMRVINAAIDTTRPAADPAATAASSPPQLKSTASRAVSSSSLPEDEDLSAGKGKEAVPEGQEEDEDDADGGEGQLVTVPL
jgi:uncharacterized membrane protein